MRLPMFPLGGVLLPGEAIPLHVFEPRYRVLVHDVLRQDDPDFGIVLIERGSEVGGGDVRFGAGTRSRIVQRRELTHGRWAIVAGGIERIRVVEWLPDDPYPVAEVEAWPDKDDGPADTAPLLDRLRPLLDAVPARVDDTWRLASLLPVGPLDRLRILEAPGPAERLRRLAEALDDLEAVLAAGGDGG